MKKILVTFAYAAIVNILPAQNVGIGTATPTDGRLHVVNAGSSTAAMFSDGSTGVALINENSRPGVGLNMYYAGEYKFKGAGYSGLFYYVPGEGRMTYYSSTVLGAAGGSVAFRSLFTILPGGNVGISTSAPNLARLVVQGASNTTHLISTLGEDLPGVSQSVAFGSYPVVGFNTYFGNAHRFLSPGYGAIIQYQPLNGILSFGTSQTKGAAGETIFFNSNSVAIDSSGYMGIGTTAPKARLHVTNNMVVGPSASLPATGFLLSVDGKIICEELKVQLSTSWPDYVFEDSYKLPSIDNLKQTVMTNKHLPGIPSAAQVSAANGYAMGDMQKRLLEKVEELYRYVFILNDENKAMKAELAAIKANK